MKTEFGPTFEGHLLVSNISPLKTTPWSSYNTSFQNANENMEHVCLFCLFV